MGHHRQILLALTLVASGCGHGLRVHTPPGFVVLAHHGGYAYRATNAEGVVIAVRSMANEPQGDLAFWAAAVDARLRRDYAAVSVEEVRTEAGLPGRQIRYQVSRGGRPHRYWATVFVTRSHVYVVEAGGDQAFFDPSQEAVEATIRSFDPS